MSPVDQEQRERLRYLASTLDSIRDSVSVLEDVLKSPAEDATWDQIAAKVYKEERNIYALMWTLSTRFASEGQRARKTT